MRALTVTLLLAAGCYPNPLPDDDVVAVEDPSQTDPGEDRDALTTWLDLDGDGFGDPLTAASGIDDPTRVSNGDDCDDTDPAIHPGADEVCDGRDQDCDGQIDEEALDAQAFFLDRDGDGFGSLPLGRGCSLPVGASARSDDCDDTDAAVFPGADEPLCSRQDLDCDGQAGAAATLGERGYPTIQAALDASGPGSRIVVCEGNYVEALRVDHGVRLVGQTADPERSQLAAPPGERLLVGSGDWFTLRGLTLVGETVEAGDGGAVRIESNTLHVEACRFVGGEARDGDGGALHWRGVTSADGTPAEVRIEDTWFDGGSARRGGAAWLQVQGDGAVELDGLRVRDNRAAGRGGGIGMRLEGPGGRLEVVDSRFEDNVSTSGGGLYVEARASAKAAVEASLFRANDAAQGAGLTMTRGTLSLQRVRLESQLGSALQASDLTANDSSILDTDGPAGLVVTMVWDGGRLLRNAAGLEGRERASLVRVDLGVGRDANEGYDLSVRGRTWDGTGVSSITCDRSGCR